MGRWRLLGQQQQNSDGGANGGNGVGDSASGGGSEIWGGARERLGLVRGASLGAAGTRTLAGRSSVRVPTVAATAGTPSSMAR